MNGFQLIYANYYMEVIPYLFSLNNTDPPF